MKREDMGIFCLIKNREKIPMVINNRMETVHQILSDSKSITTTLRKLRILFERTKVQIGEYWSPDNKRHIFIRNGFKNKAHFLIERKPKI